MTETTDQLIDHALGLSARAQPPSGIQQRIVANAKSHARGVSRTSVLGFLVRYAGWRLPIVSAVTAALLCALIWSHRQRADQHAADIAHSQMNTPINVLAKHDQFNTKLLSISNQTVEPIQNEKVRRIEAQHEVVRVEVATALDDMHAPSKPAPEMPLTSEEKLLVRAVRSNTPVLLAELEPINRINSTSKVQAEEKMLLKNLIAPMTSVDLDDRNTEPSSSVSSTPQTLETSTNSINGEPQ